MFLMKQLKVLEVLPGLVLQYYPIKFFYLAITIAINYDNRIATESANSHLPWERMELFDSYEDLNFL